MTNNGNHKPFSFALIGCGRISQVHLQMLSKEPHARLLAVADIDAKAAQSVGEIFSVPAYNDSRTMLENVKPEAVILCTPPSTHRSLAEEALSVGAHVLCEKPLALTVEDADAMLRRAEDEGRLLMMASKFRYVKDVIRAKEMIDSGLLGEVVLFENVFCSRVDMKGRWNSKPAIGGGGVLIDNGSHSVDIFRYVIGPVDRLQATYGKRSQKIDVEDTCHLHLVSVDGTIGSIDLSWSIHKEDPYFIRIFGTAGMLEIGWKGSRYRQSEKLEWVTFGTGYDKFQAVGRQLANFIDVIAGRGDPMITDEDALESVRVIQTAYRTADQPAWEKVEH